VIGTLFGTAGKPVVVKGYAQEFELPIKAIQFSCDGGSTWTTYPTESAEPDCNVNWEFSFTPPAEGFYTLLIRAVNSAGVVTPEPATVNLEVAAT